MADATATMTDDPEYVLQMFSYEGEIFVAFERLGITEYIVAVGELTNFLERHDRKWFFEIDEEPTIIPEPDDNPDFITNIPAIDNFITRIKAK